MFSMTATGLVVLGAFYLHYPDRAPLRYSHHEDVFMIYDRNIENDKKVYRIMIGLTVASLITSLISIPLLYIFLRRRSISSHLNATDEQPGAPFTINSCVPSYPPSYDDAVQQMDATSWRLKEQHTSCGTTSPPQYTDFRVAFYAQPPPYSEKSTSSAAL
ncbi:unnamed protein product [Gongylonema pulchrum]|uniref:G_PROTEIN_RECEP_F1_2 domain-containing protein n=1 Tax=Gongylonema pulchrum TaxID=637853 RepID=A0A183D858_9BILA|nr:unnamed protein product [Gongylonema pulchrum]